MSLIARKFIIFFLLIVLILVSTNSVSAQDAVEQVPEAMAVQAQPPMKNVFMNVLWGSLSGGLLMMGWATLDDSVDSDDRYTFSNLSEQFIVGATYGGILGVAAGVYFSIRGISFDENLSRIALYPDYSDNPEGRRFLAKSRSRQDKKTVNLLNIHFNF
jgi:hypothetical protein